MGFRTVFITTLGIFANFWLHAQNGGDQVGQIGRKFDRLNVDNGHFTSANSSRALGVYQSSDEPRSLLEVNSTLSRYRWLHPNLNSRGELFRTSAPADVDASWRLFQGGDQMGRLWSPASRQDFHLRAPRGDLRFWGSDTDPAAFQVETMRVWGADENGGVSINEDNAVVPMPRIALLNLGTYVGHGQRSWMENGLFAGVASDGLYLGMKAEDGDHNDAVLSWNDNADPHYRDHLRFLFTQKGNEETDAAGPNGLEMGRFDPGNGEEENREGAHPENNGLGLGNFYDPNEPDEPVTTRLDVLNGDVRIRELPHRFDEEAGRVVVVRPNGVLRVREASILKASAGTLDSIKQALEDQSERIDRLKDRLASLEEPSDGKAFQMSSSSPKNKLRPISIRPNPFRERTVISYELSEPGRVRLLIRELNGGRVVRSLEVERGAGRHEEQLNGSGLDPGTYYCVLRVDGVEKVRKLVKLE